MELNEFRNVMENLRVDIWSLIDRAIDVACVDYSEELRNRRDAIVQRLYAPTMFHCRSCQHRDCQKHHRPSDSPQDLQPKIIVIKNQLETPHQDQENLVHMLQCLLKMDITFDALKETDIGRQVNRFRKHQSNDVRRLVKLLVRKWKETVDEWVRLNTPHEAGGSSSNGDGDSPHHKNNIQSGFIDNGDAFTPPTFLTPKGKDANDNVIELENSALLTRKRLHENYQGVENAKKERTTQEMEFHNAPKTRNPFFSQKTNDFAQVKQYW